MAPGGTETHAVRAPLGYSNTCFSAANPAAPFKDMPRHCSGSLGLASCLAPLFGKIFWNETEHVSCPVCMGCLEQCFGVCLGLWGKCWGNVEPEVQDGSTLFWDRHSGGKGGVGCEVLGVVS